MGWRKNHLAGMGIYTSSYPTGKGNTPLCAGRNELQCYYRSTSARSWDKKRKICTRKNQKPDMASHIRSVASKTRGFSIAYHDSAPV